MFKGVRVASWSRMLDSSAILKTSISNGVTVVRCCSGTKKHFNESREATHIMPFSEFVQSRLFEATRSLLVNVNSEKNLCQLFSVCEKYGEIKNVFRCKFDGREAVLIEMKDNNYSELFDNITVDGAEGLPYQCSPFVTAHFDSIVVTPTKFTSGLVKNVDQSVNRNDSNSVSSDNFLWNLYDDGKLNDFHIRLRFLIVSQLQTVLSGLWKNASVVPFGGSVNGFGNNFSDLDMTVLFETAKDRFITYRNEIMLSPAEQRSNCLKVISSILKNFLPGCKYVTPIPAAQVPIVKFYHMFVGLECDVSVQSVDGIISSETMYYISQMHDMVRPLAFIAKKWAKCMNIIRSQPSKTISNFGFLAMVIFFLQQQQQQQHTKNFKLPPFSAIDIIGDSEIPFSSKRYEAFMNIVNDQKGGNQKINLDALLYSFFDYYSKFNFRSYGICLNTGKIVENKKRVPLLIINPWRSNMNVTKQVTDKEVEKIRLFCQIAKKLCINKERYTKDLFDIKNYNYREASNPSFKIKTVMNV